MVSQSPYLAILASTVLIISTTMFLKYNSYSENPPLIKSQENSDNWVKNHGINCYTNHGATDLEDSQGSSAGSMSITECQS